MTSWRVSRDFVCEFLTQDTRNQPLLEIELGNLRPTIILEASVYAGPGDFSGEIYWEPLDDSLACSQRFKTKAIFFPPPSDGSMGETAE